ncbi:UDP-N-acetylglucosamine transporter-like isoform X2 [Montipora foliosa]|uniref:UDP-N-acetylglucosamine transporter-like isoform X2 n=1 Tax=Montipora foliosa TaxID=591990 RepID=UPI0035F1835E
MNCSRQNLRLSSGKVAKDGDSPLENSKNHYKESESSSFTSTAGFRTIIFAVLTLQATCYFSLLRYSRTRPHKMYFSSTAVFLAEVMKLLVTLVVIFLQHRNLKQLGSFLVQSFLMNPLDTLKLSVASVLYVIQNNLVYIAMTHLESTTFQVSNQLKIISTAIFSIALLKKQLTRRKWICLVFLSVGVAMVQIDSHTSVQASILRNSDNVDSKKEHSTLLGLGAVLASSLVSGFAGVYMEKIFKQQRRKSFWLANAQLYTIGIVLGLVGVFYQDGPQIAEMGFFHGYDFVVCLVVLFASAGGIIVSLVLKYASCITKGFATSCAIVLSSVVSVYVFDFVPSMQFIVGAASVISAVLMYS